MHSEPSLLGVLRAKMRGAASSKAKLRGASENYSTASRTILTQHIIKMARDGERDPRWLADSALLYLSQQKLTSTPGRRSLIELVNYARLDWLTLFEQNYCGRETLRGTNLSPSDFGLSVRLLDGGVHVAAFIFLAPSPSLYVACASNR